MEECADCFWYLNLYMVEQGLGGKIVDDVWEGLLDMTSQLSQMREDPWMLVETTLGLSALCASLFVEGEERGFSDAEGVEMIATSMGLLLVYSNHTMSDALTRNIAKLAKRYGDTYSDYMALNRDTSAERQVLEGGAG
jgi:hypothetical protein